MDHVLKAGPNENITWRWQPAPVSTGTFAYADDIVLIAESEISLQHSRYMEAKNRSDKKGMTRR